MTDLIFKALAYVVVIILGYTLKKVGFFGPNDYKILTKILFNITIPAAILSNIGQVSLESSLFLLAIIGLLVNLTPSLVGFLLTRKKDLPDRLVTLINMPGYNIGAFVLPLAQSFLGPGAMTATCIFDVGNSVMCLGGNYSVAQALSGKEGGFHPLAVAGKLLRSVPFLCYLVFLFMAAFQLPMPGFVRSVISVIAPANGFVAMLMIGTTMEFKLERQYLGRAITILAARYLTATGMALLAYFCTPFPLEARQTLALCIFAPISAMAPAFTDQAGCDVALSGLVNTLSIMVSIVVIMTMMTLMIG